jgi:hypothetical protein
MNKIQEEQSEVATLSDAEMDAANGGAINLDRFIVAISKDRLRNTVAMMRPKGDPISPINATVPEVVNEHETLAWG